MLGEVAGTLAKMKLGGVSLSNVLKKIEDGVTVAREVSETSENAASLIQRFRRSTAHSDVSVTTKTCDVQLSVRVPSLTLVYTVTNYTSVEVVLVSAFAAYRVNDFLISGLACSDLGAVAPKSQVQLEITHNLGSSEILVCASHIRAKHLQAETRLELTYYRARWVGRRLSRYTLPWAPIVPSVTGSVSTKLVSPADARLMRKLLRSYDKC